MWLPSMPAFSVDVAAIDRGGTGPPPKACCRMNAAASVTHSGRRRPQALPDRLVADRWPGIRLKAGAGAQATTGSNAMLADHAGHPELRGDRHQLHRAQAERGLAVPTTELPLRHRPAPGDRLHESSAQAPMSLQTCAMIRGPSPTRSVASPST